MTDPFLTLDRASLVLPDGRTLFSELDLQLDGRATGLVGRNGVGKSLLAQLLAAEIEPTSGKRRASGRVCYLPQQIQLAQDASVASLAGVDAQLKALARIEAGSCAPADFDAIAERWEIRQQLAQALAGFGLPGLAADRPAATLSGGEAMRVALAGAFLSEADFLILDEPSNHLDAAQRQRLHALIGQWPNGLLVISHDRRLLDTFARIEELSSSGLRSYGGGYSFYAQRKQEEQAHLQRELDHAKADVRKQELALREQQQRQQRRQARGQRDAREANQAPILLGLRKDRAEGSAGRLAIRQLAAREQLATRLRQAVRGQQDASELALFAPDAGATHEQRIVLRLQAAVLPFVPASASGMDLAISARQRIGVVGANGSGKSSLLKVLAGQLAPLHGRRVAHVPVAWLDQRLSGLDPAASVLAQLRRANPAAAEAVLRTRLALLGLEAGHIECPSGQLSGGERLKAALACVLYAAQPPGLLLLDEPGNHLDLPGLAALEGMLGQFRSALVIVSHDEALLERLHLSHRLRLSAQQGLLVAC